MRWRRRHLRGPETRLPLRHPRGMVFQLGNERNVLALDEVVAGPAMAYCMAVSAHGVCGINEGLFACFITFPLGVLCNDFTDTAVAGWYKTKEWT